MFPTEVEVLTKGVALPSEMQLGRNWEPICHSVQKEFYSLWSDRNQDISF